MTLTLVRKKGSCPKEYICEIGKLYHLPFKNYGQCKRVFFFFFCTNKRKNGQTDRQTNVRANNYMPPIYRCEAIKSRSKAGAFIYSEKKKPKCRFTACRLFLQRFSNGFLLRVVHSFSDDKFLDLSKLK